jgi:tRNA dimethylallyltransferase
VVRPLIAIVGPTASGKSDLALAIAERNSGELVNCDSLQLYRGFDVGTAKTPAVSRRGISHHLFDVLEAQKRFSAGDYARAARQVIENISRRGALTILVGGTGFYVRALLDGLPSLPRRDAELRVRLAEREQRRPGSLHRLLRRLEPTSASAIHPRDVQKLTRALEIRILTGAALPPQSSASPLEGFRTLQIGLAPDRALLNEAIAQRTRAMFQSGLIEEVRGLLASGLTGAEKPFESLGYKQTLQHIRGELSLEAAINSTEIETRQYAKRQMTWFRRDTRIHWITGFGSDPGVQSQAMDLIDRFLSQSVQDVPL